MKRFYTLFLLASLALVHTALAQVPKTIGYQGVLTDASGTPLPDGDYALTFTLYDAATNGTALWSETQTATVTAGVFSVALGSVTELTLVFDAPYWLGVAVGTDSELSPRMALSAAPYSLGPPAMVTAPANGENFALRDTDGTTAHLFSPNGDALHEGVGTFRGGIFVGTDTTTIVLPDTTIGKGGAEARTGGLPRVGVFGKGSSVGVQGQSTSGWGIWGISQSSDGVRGRSDSGKGVFGFSQSNAGVSGLSFSGTGIAGKSLGGKGVVGNSSSKTGVEGNSTSGNGVEGISASGTGVQGTSKGQSGVGVKGVSDSFMGVLGKSKTFVGVGGDSDSGPGVWGISKSDAGVRGSSVSDIGVQGTSGTGVAMDASSASSTGLRAEGTPAGDFIGKVKISDVPMDAANNRVLVWGTDKVVKYKTLSGGGGGDSAWISEANNTISTTSNVVVRDSGGNITTSFNADGTSLHTGKETFSGGIDIKDAQNNLVGVIDNEGFAVRDGSGNTVGGIGRTDVATGNRIGVFGMASGPGGKAGVFDGDTEVNGGSFTMKDAGDNVVFQVNEDGTSLHTGLETFTGGISVKNADGTDAVLMQPDQDPITAYTMIILGNLHILGLLIKSAGSFRIDHPLDPENKYLYHSFVESPDMMNVYNGNVVLDATGEAEVELPTYFEALNMDFRYQLTAVGGPGPNLYIAQKISENRFRIAGGSPGLEVSWQVTGIRNDKYARENRIQVEVDKN